MAFLECSDEPEHMFEDPAVLVVQPTLELTRELTDQALAHDAAAIDDERDQVLGTERTNAAVRVVVETTHRLMERLRLIDMADGEGRLDGPKPYAPMTI